MCGSTVYLLFLLNYHHPPKERSINADVKQRNVRVPTPCTRTVQHISLGIGYVDLTVLLFHVCFINSVMPHGVIATTN